MSPHPPWYFGCQKLPLVLVASILVSAMIAGLRHTGILEGIEMWSDDKLIQWRGESKSDSRILLVAIDDSTRKKLNSDQISDEVLTLALKQLEQYQPRVIGINISRDVPIGHKRQELINYVEGIYEPLTGKVKPIIFSCELPSVGKPTGIDPPPIVEIDSSVGFTNIGVDSDDVVRRIPIASIPGPNASNNSRGEIQNQFKPKCLVPFSLGFLVSLSYLKGENIDIEQTVEGFFKLGDVTFKPSIAKGQDGQNPRTGEYQIILDYRLKNKVEQISLAQVLEGQIQPEQIKDRAILIGEIKNTLPVYNTPYGRVPEVLIHAQVINQVLSNVLDGRPVLWDIPEPLEWLWIIFWGVGGGIIAWKYGARWQFYLIQGGALLILVGGTCLIFRQQGNLPLIAPVFSFVLCGTVGITLSKFLDEKSNLGENLIKEPQPITEPNGDSTTEKLTTPGPKPKPALPRIDNLIGQTIGERNRYRIESELGKGGMGQVFKACDLILEGKPVAIKVMTAYSGSDNQHLITRFKQEVKIMASFSSVNIVGILDYGLTPEDSPFKGSPFYVMEYLLGATLDQRLKAVGHLEVKDAIPLIYQICAGLREAHNLGYVHRDLKPENIYLVGCTLGEIVKILDFGIAKIVSEYADDSQSHLTKEGMFLGTYRYASPEQCEGKVNIDQRTDIYSLGILIYEMLTGENPYKPPDGQSDRLAFWISSHTSKKPQPLRSQKGCENLPPRIEAVVMRCLEKSPDDRFANVDELEDALRKAMTDYFGNHG